MKAQWGGVEVELLSFFNLSTWWRWVVSATFRLPYAWEGPGTHCIRGWVGLRAGLDGCGKTHPRRGSNLPTVHSLASIDTDYRIPALRKTDRNMF